MSFDEDVAQAREPGRKHPKRVRIMDGEIAKLDLDLGALLASGRRDKRAAAKARGILRRRRDLVNDIGLAGFDATELDIDRLIRDE